VDVTNGTLGFTGGSFGVGWEDFDNNGHLELLVINAGGSNRFFTHKNYITFEEIDDPMLAGQGGSFGMCVGDYDNDGDNDLYIANGIGPNRLLRNDSGLAFTEVNAGDASDPGPSQSPSWVDYDLDGDLDLFVTAWGAPCHLFRNEGGTFVDATPPALADSMKATGAAWGDYDNDGDPDLYLGARVGGRLLRNEGGGAFTDVTTGPLLKAGITGAAWADYDNDGDLDIYLARDVLNNRLIRNENPDSLAFVDVYNPLLRDESISQSVLWLDYDNDGNIDLFLTNAGIDNASGASNRLFRNNGSDDSFSDLLNAPIVAVANSRGAAVGDYDGNGYPDLYVANWGGPNQLLRNAIAGNGKHYIKIRLQGTTSNRSGIGARIRVVGGGKTQIREVTSGSSLFSHNELSVIFGLDSSTIVDSIQVRWPSGIVTDTTNVPADQLIVLLEQTDQTGVGDGLAPVQGVRLLANTPNPFRSRTVIRYEMENASAVDLAVFDIRGRLVRVLERGSLREPGAYEVSWDGVSDRGVRVAPGIYFYRLQGRDFAVSRRMVFVR
jgi:hypothetical protein